MKTEIFNIAIPVSAARAEQAAASLKAIPGVREVTYLDRPARLEALGMPTRPGVIITFSLKR